ncbi:cyclic nucleotide-binding domain-containing protein 2-like [Discoglossus pictus]
MTLYMPQIAVRTVCAELMDQQQQREAPCTMQESATSTGRPCKLLQCIHKVMIVQEIIRRFIRRGEAARGSAFWGDVQVSIFPTEEPNDEEEEKVGKKKRRRKLALAFDTSVFKSQYEFTFPEKAIEVALRKPEERSQHDIRFIRSMMMGILNFRRYSTQMQLMLARVVYYQRFGRGRVIVRKGHRGDSFYFVFSGAIAVTQDEDGSSAFLDPEPILLHKGASFGEVALLKGLRRNATIICMEDTEFLVVDRHEFFRNKLDQELKKELRYRFDFFRSLDLFSSWSDESLETLADHCKTEECHHSHVMVNNTSETKNIIFVTQGRCEVLRLVDLSQCPAFLKWIKQHEALLGRPMLPLNTFSAKPRIYRKTSNYKNEPKNTRAEKRSLLESRALLTTENIARRNGLDMSSAEVSRSLDLPQGLVAAVYLRIDSIQPGQYFKGVDVHFIESCLERAGHLSHDQTSLPTLDHRDPRSMTIISQGAEVIRIKLDKFSELADVTTLKKLKAQVQPYPSDNELCMVFLEQNRWKVFKADMVSHLSGVPQPHPSTHPKQHPRAINSKKGNKSADRSGILQLGTHSTTATKSNCVFNSKASMDFSVGDMVIPVDVEDGAEDALIKAPKKFIRGDDATQFEVEMKFAAHQAVVHIIFCTGHHSVAEDDNLVICRDVLYEIAQFWTTPKQPKAPDAEKKKENELPPIQAPMRLIHGIDIPKLCGKRIMW